MHTKHSDRAVYASMTYPELQTLLARTLALTGCPVHGNLHCLRAGMIRAHLYRVAKARRIWK